MDQQRIDTLGDELYTALRARTVVDPLTTREPGLTLDDAYRISRRMLDRRLADGEKVVGKKIGCTSKAVQRMLNVDQPDFGYLTDRTQYADGAEMPISRELIQPKAEGEIAFVLKKDLRGPGITAKDVLAATDYVSACFEVVDSRVRDWKIKIQDTVADNASAGLFIVGNEKILPSQVDLELCGMVVEKNGEIISTGAGAAALGSPLNCVAWLANAFGQLGVPLLAGEVILSGSLVPLEPVKAGDKMRVRIGGIGSTTVHFT